MARYFKLNPFSNRNKRKFRIFPLFIFLFLIIIYWILSYIMSNPYEQTLVLDEERHLFIRLFKQNDPNRKIRRPFRILSGSLHYFRVQTEQWPERILQMKKAGLNTIETYVPWNLHEPERENYQFNEGVADLGTFLKLVNDFEMFTIVRPSGYICAEWEWGGLPSWLLSDATMKIRTTHEGFLQAMKNYYSKLLPILSEHQYNRKGPGSIIAFQIENEYGSYGNDSKYLEAIRSMYVEYGLDELFFTSDGPNDLLDGALDDVWSTVNFQRNFAQNIIKLAEFRPKHHLMITEYWTGWFDYWGDKHKTGAVKPYDDKEFENDLEEILLNSNQEVSINFYMFFGGTNFGFTSGGHHFPGAKYAPLVTSYDYDAPLTEAGDPSGKFYAVQRVLVKFYERNPQLIVYNHQRDVEDKFQPGIPTTSKKVALGKLFLSGYKTWEQILNDDLLAVETKIEQGPLNMEQIRTDSIPKGLSQGFIVYTILDGEKHFQDNQEHKLKITEIADNAIILVNGEVIYSSKHTDNEIETVLPSKTKTLSIIVENMGRINFGPTLDQSRKGITGKVLLDDKIEINRWKIHGLEFRKGMSSVTEWKLVNQDNSNDQTNSLSNGPQLFNFVFDITDENSIGDTYLSLDSKWTKGVAFINGFNLGRYWNIGPQRTLYIPKQFLFKGFNHIQLFELYTWGESIELVDTPVIDS